ncbi:hypothetical protein [Buttiauxella sp. BIGb0552]|uniref:hypothetical protein n=1 Tax=Buttiauxella sp. BIGb0552 TaxID=2485120 RepID=UPI00106698C6|nr:hypothetical protein [Buttiauxella sp. BIGb0552]
MAYKAAPDWINRKNIEGGGELAQCFINIQVEDALLELDKAMFNLEHLIKIVDSENGFLKKRDNNRYITEFNSSMGNTSKNSKILNESLIKLHRFGWNFKNEFNVEILDFLGIDEWIESYDDNISYSYLALEAHKLNRVGDFKDVIYEEAKTNFYEDVNELMPELIKWKKALQKISYSTGVYNSFFKIK